METSLAEHLLRQGNKIIFCVTGKNLSVDKWISPATWTMALKRIGTEARRAGKRLAGGERSEPPEKE
jgi:hypothetical protein